jgi:hypothetical protein
VCIIVIGEVLGEKEITQRFTKIALITGERR